MSLVLESGVLTTGSLKKSLLLFIKETISRVEIASGDLGLGCISLGQETEMS